MSAKSLPQNKKTVKKAKVESISEWPSNNSPKALILYLDTSESEAVLELVDSSKEWPAFHSHKISAGRELSAKLAPAVEEILKEFDVTPAQLSGICVFVGPGSFTGLRIGISFANGLAFALGIPTYETTVRGSFDLDSPKEIALPFYGSEPKITQPKKK